MLGIYIRMKRKCFTYCYRKSYRTYQKRKLKPYATLRFTPSNILDFIKIWSSIETRFSSWNQRLIPCITITRIKRKMAFVRFFTFVPTLLCSQRIVSNTIYSYVDFLSHQTYVVRLLTLQEILQCIKSSVNHFVHSVVFSWLETALYLQGPLRATRSELTLQDFTNLLYLAFLPKKFFQTVTTEYLFYYPWRNLMFGADLPVLTEYNQKLYKGQPIWDNYCLSPQTLFFDTAVIHPTIWISTRRRLVPSSPYDPPASKWELWWT